MEPTLRVIPLGGLGEIGKNMMALEYGDDIIVVDCGVQFPSEDLLGVDLIIPDISYLLEHSEKVRSILITHGHEDHIGALVFVLPQLDVPVYAPKLAQGLISVKLKEHRSTRASTVEAIEPGEAYQFGDAFKVTWFRVCHSIPDAMGLIIETPLGTVIHTGDFKIDHTPVDGHTIDLPALTLQGAAGVLLLCSDSTYAELPGYTPSEQIMGDALDNAVAGASGRVMVATFASLISRIQQVINASQRNGRRVALVGTSMVVNSKLALKLGYLKDPHGVLLPLNEALLLPKSKVALMMTGSQGETSSILGRRAVGRNRQFDLEEGDTVIVSAHPIPGNEEVVSRTINKLIQRGARVVYEPLQPVHVSGHARAAEQKQLIRMVKPKFFIPVHGELRMLHAHSALASEVGIAAENIAVVENGTVVDLTPESLKISGRVPGGYVYVDGSGVGDIGPQVLRERDRLASDGFVIVSLLVDRETSELLNTPEITSRGFVFVRDSEKLFRRAKEKAVSTATNSPNGKIGRRVENALSEFFYKEIKRRPMVLALVNEV